MLTRLKYTAVALAAALQLLGGCAGDGPDGIDTAGDEVGETTSAIIDHGGVITSPPGTIVVAVPVDPEPPLLPNPPDDPEPSSAPGNPGIPRRFGLHTLRVPLATLQEVIPFLLSGTRISLDVTRRAPPVLQGTTRVCHRDQAAYDEARAECLLFPSNRAQCLREAAENFPLTCSLVGIPHYSYVAFTDSLKNLYPNLADKVFDLEPIERNTWSGVITIRLNQLRSTLGIGNLDILAGNRGGLPYVGLGANVQSGQPTAYCEHHEILLGCPDIELTNMHLVIRFEGLQPDPLDPSRITYSGVTAPFSFNRNLTNVPDWLVTPFFDVDGRIKARTEEKIRSTFLEDTRHVEVAKLLTNALAWYAERNDPSFTGFKRIAQVIYSQGEIVLYYVDNADIPLPDLPPLTTRD